MTTAVLKTEVQTRIDAITYSSGTLQAVEVLQLSVDTVGLHLDLTNLISVHNSMTSAIIGGTSDDDLTALNAASIALGVTSKGGSPWSFPKIPFPLNGDGLVWKEGETFPHKGTLINSITTPYNGNTQPYVGKLGTTTVWTVNVTDINAAADQWIGVYSNWYDDINDRLYVFAVDTATTPDTLYTAYITLETGAVTNVGNVLLTTDPVLPTTAGHCGVFRTAIDSGNFTLFFRDRTIVINESTGAEVSNIASTNTTESTQFGNYVTLDGTVSLFRIINGSANSSYVELTRSKNSVRVPMPEALLGNVTAAVIVVSPWGDKVKLFEGAGTANSPMLRTFLRSDFDSWLSAVADFGGLA